MTRSATILGLGALFLTQLSCGSGAGAGEGLSGPPAAPARSDPAGGPVPEQPACCMPPEPDYEEAIRHEFASSRAEGTREALVRFIARHPGHPRADTARELLRQHAGREGSPSGIGAGDPDADVYEAFDTAIRQNTVAAYDSFVERYSSHPLSEEARRLRDQLQ